LANSIQGFHNEKLLESNPQKTLRADISDRMNLRIEMRILFAYTQNTKPTINFKI
jgi:hypothetical protein